MPGAGYGSATYDVITRYRLDTGDLSAQAAKAQSAGEAAARSLKEVETRMKGLDGMVGHLKTMLVAGFGIHKLLEVKNTIYESIGQMEQMRLGIGGVLAATGAGTFARSMELGKERLSELVEYAKSHVGTFEDYASVFQTVLAPVRGAGGSSSQAAELAKKLVPVSMAMGGPHAVQSLGYQLTEAITIGLAGRMAPELQRIIKAVGISREAFNAMTGSQKIEALLKGAEKFKEMVAAGENTMNAQTTTLKSNVMGLGRILGEPMFEGTKQSLRDINAWIEKNRGGLEKWAHLIGNTMVSAIVSLSNAVKAIGSSPVFQTLALAGGAFLGGKLLFGGGSRMVSGLAGMLTSGASGLVTSMATRGLVTAVPSGIAVGSTSGLIGGALVGLAGLAAKATLVGAALYGFYEVLDHGVPILSNLVLRWRDGDAIAAGQTKVRVEYESRLARAMQAQGARGETWDSMGKKFIASRGHYLPELKSAYAAGSTDERFLHLVFGYGKPFEKAMRLLNPKDPEKAAKSTVTVNVVIKQDFRDVKDPDRIATATKKALVSLARAPTQGARPFSRTF